MKTKNNTPAIWVRFTPYLVTWAEHQYGTALTLYGRPVLELRPIPGIRFALRETVDDDADLTSAATNSLSQVRYALILHGVDVQQDKITEQFGLTKQELSTFLPVHVPDYLLTSDGSLRQFSPTMQLRRKTANDVARCVYGAFWKEVHRFAQAGDFAIDKDMLTSFCEEAQIGDINIDDLRNQYQRMKRSNYFLNKS